MVNVLFDQLLPLEPSHVSASRKRSWKIQNTYNALWNHSHTVNQDLIKLCEYFLKFWWYSKKDQQMTCFVRFSTFVQSKKREKHSWRGVTFSTVMLITKAVDAVMFNLLILFDNWPFLLIWILKSKVLICLTLPQYLNILITIWSRLFMMQSYAWPISSRAIPSKKHSNHREKSCLPTTRPTKE